MLIGNKRHFLLATNDLRLFRLISILQRGKGARWQKPHFLEWLDNFATDCRFFVRLSTVRVGVIIVRKEHQGNVDRRFH